MFSGKREAVTSQSTLILSVLRGGFVGLAVILLTLVGMALCLSAGLLPLSAAVAVSCIAMAVGAFFAGWSAAKKSGKNGLLIGVLCGFGLFLLFSLIGLCAFGKAPGASTVIRLLLFVTAAAIGGIIGIGSADKRKIV